MSARDKMVAGAKAVASTTTAVAKRAGRAVASVPGGTMRVVRRGARKIQSLILNLLTYWYVARRRHPSQERFLFGGWTKKGGPKYRGLLGGRGLGKSYALMRKALLLAFLNRGTKELPIWGAIFGRTLKEVDDKLLPVLREVCAELERDFGIPISPVHDKGRGILVFPFGAAIYLLSYESRASLALARGYNLGWAVIDELEVAPVPIDEILAVINFAIRDPRAKHKCLAWASTPKGLKGMPKLHLEAWKRGDPNWFLVHGTIYDNPWLTREDIDTIKATIPSKRMWDQEGLAICVAPRNTVLPEYSERVHVRPYVWNTRHKTVVIIDWGTTKAYVGACKVDERGVWTVARERKVVDTTRPRFRQIVREFVAEIMRMDGGEAPYAFACDRAVASEKYWLAKTFGRLCEGRVLWLESSAEQLVEWGCAIISSMLEPDDGAAPRLYLAEDLSPSLDFATMGMRGAMQRYQFELVRDKNTGEEFASQEPNKINAADDPVDALRYGIVATRHMAELHGGRPLPFIDDPTKVPTAKEAKKKGALRRLALALGWGAANDNDGEARAAA